MAQRTQVCAEFNPELAHIDPYLELVFWPDHVPAPMGFVAGRYHIVRHNPGAPGSVEPLVAADGGFRQPDSSLFEFLRASDMWNEQAMRDRRRVMQSAKDAQAAREHREAEDRREELRDRVNAATRTSVSMTDVPWSQNAQGARGRKA